MSDEVEERVRSDVEEHGWHVVQIPPEQDTPGWAFTIGLVDTFSFSEVVVFGLDIEVMKAMLDNVGLCLREGIALEPYALYEYFMEGFDCVLKPVYRRWCAPLLGTAVSYHGGDGFGAMQMFWPDRAHFWPWDPDVEPGVARSQPLLDREEVEDARLQAILDTLASGR